MTLWATLWCWCGAWIALSRTARAREGGPVLTAHRPDLFELQHLRLSLTNHDLESALFSPSCPPRSQQRRWAAHAPHGRAARRAGVVRIVPGAVERGAAAAAGQPVGASACGYVRARVVHGGALQVRRRSAPVRVLTLCSVRIAQLAWAVSLWWTLRLHGFLAGDWTLLLTAGQGACAKRLRCVHSAMGSARLLAPHGVDRGLGHRCTRRAHSHDTQGSVGTGPRARSLRWQPARTALTWMLLVALVAMFFR